MPCKLIFQAPLFIFFNLPKYSGRNPTEEYGGFKFQKIQQTPLPLMRF